MTVHNPIDARAASSAGTPTSRPSTFATSGAATSPATTSATSPRPTDPASGAPGAGDPLLESPATLDVFALGRRAAAARDARWGATASWPIFAPSLRSPLLRSLSGSMPNSNSW